MLRNEYFEGSGQYAQVQLLLFYKLPVDMNVARLLDFYPNVLPPQSLKVPLPNVLTA